MLDSMYMTMSISSGLYPNLDLWNANKLQLQLQLQLHVQKLNLKWLLKKNNACRGRKDCGFRSLVCEAVLQG